MSKEMTAEEAIESIIKGAEALGWNVAIPGVDDEEAECPGMILGTDQYIDDVIDGKYKE